MSKPDKKPFVESVNEPGVIYVTTSELKNRLGEVLDLAMDGEKQVILKKHGREILKLTKIKSEKKDVNKLHDTFFGSQPDLEIDPDFRKGFKFRDFTSE
jgi:prevent-host-death family protein